MFVCLRVALLLLSATTVEREGAEPFVPTRVNPAPPVCGENSVFLPRKLGFCEGNLVSSYGETTRVLTVIK